MHELFVCTVQPGEDRGATRMDVVVFAFCVVHCKDCFLRILDARLAALRCIWNVPYDGALLAVVLRA